MVICNYCNKSKRKLKNEHKYCEISFLNGKKVIINEIERLIDFERDNGNIGRPSFEMKGVNVKGFSPAICLSDILKLLEVLKRPKEKENKKSLSKLMQKNPMWKENDMNLITLHEWIKTHKLKPALCENCHLEEPFDLANISGEYKRDINDFEWLCRRCHMKKDGRLKELINARPKREQKDKQLKCNQCNQFKFPKEFYRDKRTFDGYRYKCKNCEKEYRKQLRSKKK